MINISKRQLKQIINEVLDEIQTTATTDRILGRGKWARQKPDPDAAANAVISAINSSRSEAEKAAMAIRSNSPRSIAQQKRNILKKQRELMVKIKDVENEIMQIAYGDHSYTDLQRTKFFNQHKNKQKRNDFIENFPESDDLWKKLSILRRELGDLADQLRKLFGLPSDF